MLNNSIEASLQQGEKYLYQGQYDSGLELFISLLEEEPENLKTLLNISRIYYELQKYQDSLSYLNKILSIDNNSIPALFRRGLIYKQTSEENLDRFDFERGIQIPATTCDDWIARGSIYFELEKFEDALKCHDRAIAINQDSCEAWMYRGIVLSKIEELAKAVDSFRKAINLNQNLYQAWVHQGITFSSFDETKYLEKALNCFKQAIAINENIDRAWMYRGITLGKLKKFSEAYDSFNRPLDSDTTENFKIFKYFGIVLGNQGKEENNVQAREEAISKLDIAIKINPSDWEVWYYKGITLYALKRYDDALNCYDRSISIDPDNENIWKRRTNCLKTLIKEKQFNTICNSWDKVIEFKQNDAESLCMYGRALFSNGNMKLAIEKYDESIQIDDLFLDAFFLKGRALQELSPPRYEDAIECYQQVIDKTQDRIDLSDAYYYVGKVFQKIDDLNNALDYYKKATAEDADNAKAWYARGKVLTINNDYDGALSSFECVLSIDHKHSWAWNGKGNVQLFNRSQPTEAIESYRQALYHSQNQSWMAWENLGYAQQQIKTGYKSVLKTWKDGIDTLSQEDRDNYQIGCGRLYHRIGKLLYEEGLKSNNVHLWKKAIENYNKSIEFLSKQQKYQERYLSAIQDLATVLLAMDTNESETQAYQLLRDAKDRLDRLIAETSAPLKKKELALQFSGLNELTVSYHIRAGDRISAIETTEEGKNACLTWLLTDWKEKDEIEQCTWEDMRDFVDDREAIIYWYLSPNAITTFVIKNNFPEPIVINSVTENFSDETPDSAEDIPNQIAKLKRFEQLVSDWKKSYMERRENKTTIQNSDWFTRLESIVETLGNILDISSILPHLDSIERLVLIPHRDLHRFPLHALFPDNMTISYLPSIKSGLKLINRVADLNGKILNIANPKHTNYHPLPFADFESSVINQIMMNNQPTVIENVSASKTAVISALTDAHTILHFSGHAIHDISDPKNSSLMLTGDEQLTLEDILNVNLDRYDLVTLSACETGITEKQTITQEYVGLVSAFLYQRCANIVTTLWQVPDEASSLFTIYFYRQIAKGKAPVIALLKSTKWLKSLTEYQREKIYKLILRQIPENEYELRPFIRSKCSELKKMNQIDKSKKPFEHPYYWRAFTITGIIGRR